MTDVLRVDPDFVVKHYHRVNPDGRWFSPFWMQTFRTVVNAGFVARDGSLFFVTSERLSPDTPREYSVRWMDPQGQITTCGVHQGHPTHKLALTEARRLAEESK